MTTHPHPNQYENAPHSFAYRLWHGHMKAYEVATIHVLALPALVMLYSVGLVALSGIYQMLHHAGWLTFSGRDWFAYGLTVVFWPVLGLTMLATCVGLWRSARHWRLPVRVGVQTYAGLIALACLLLATHMFYACLTLSGTYADKFTLAAPLLQ